MYHFNPFQTSILKGRTAPELAKLLRWNEVLPFPNAGDGRPHLFIVIFLKDTFSPVITFLFRDLQVFQLQGFSCPLGQCSMSKPQIAYFLHREHTFNRSLSYSEIVGKQQIPQISSRPRRSATGHEECPSMQN